MSVRRRTVRQFRPSIDRLEALAPVSTLMLGSAVTTQPTLKQPDRTCPLEKPAVARRSLVASRPSTSRGTTASRGAVSADAVADFLRSVVVHTQTNSDEVGPPNLPNVGAILNDPHLVGIAHPAGDSKQDTATLPATPPTDAPALTRGGSPQGAFSNGSGSLRPLMVAPLKLGADSGQPAPPPATQSANAPAANAPALIRGGSPQGASSSGSGSIRPLTMAPIGFGPDSGRPAPSQLLFDESGGGSPPIADSENPTLMVSGDMIGGPGGGEVQNANNIKSVTWTVSGAKKQQYSKPLGKTEDWPSPHIGGTTESWAWDENPGNHQVSALVTYTDNSTDSVGPMTVSIAQPTVNSFTTSAAAIQWGDIPGPRGDGFFGNMTIAASVSVPAQGAGEIAVIQKVSATLTIVTRSGQNQDVTHAKASAGFVLDDVPNADGENAWVDGKTAVASGQTATLSLVDPPFLAVTTSANDLGCKSVDDQSQYIDYLVYRPTGGIWVKIAEVSAYNASGTATWDGVNGPNDFANGHWDVTGTSPATNRTGYPSLGFVSWTNYWTNLTWVQPFT